MPWFTPVSSISINLNHSIAGGGDDEEGDDADNEEDDGELADLKNETALEYIRYVKSASLVEVGEEPIVTDHQARMLMLAVSTIFWLEFPLVSSITTFHRTCLALTF